MCYCLTRLTFPGRICSLGHSYGGIHIRMFASQYPEGFLAWFLVDVTHPDRDEKWIAALPTDPE